VNNVGSVTHENHYSRFFSAGRNNNTFVAATAPNGLPDHLNSLASSEIIKHNLNQPLCGINGFVNKRIHLLAKLLNLTWIVGHAIDPKVKDHHC
jgi:hypothetical protein